MRSELIPLGQRKENERLIETQKNKGLYSDYSPGSVSILLAFHVIVADSNPRQVGWVKFSDDSIRSISA